MESNMTIRTTMIAAALLMTTALGTPALADSWNGHDTGNGYASGDNSYGYQGTHNGYGDQRDGGSFRDHDSYDQGRYGFGDDTRQRLERIEHWVRYMIQSGELNRWQTHRAFDMLHSVREEASYGQRDGRTSPWERAKLDRSLDQLVSFLRDSQNNGRGFGGHNDRDDRDGPNARDYNY